MAQLLFRHIREFETHCEAFLASKAHRQALKSVPPQGTVCHLEIAVERLGRKNSPLKLRLADAGSVLA